MARRLRSIGLVYEKGQTVDINEHMRNSLLNLDSIGDDVFDSIGVGTTFEVAEQQASKVGVHTLVAADELVQEGETGHQDPLLEPEDRCEEPERRYPRRR
jgi:hypothetical protein